LAFLCERRAEEEVILLALAGLLAAPDIVLQSGHGANISALAFSPDGKYLVSASEDATLKLWDPISGAEMRTLRGHSNVVTALAVNADGREIASASLDHTLRVWNAATGEGIASFRGPAPSVYLLKITPDSSSLITAETVAAGTVLRIWDIKSGQQLRAIKRDDAAVSQLFFSGSTLLVAEESGDDDSRGSLATYNLKTGRLLQTRPGLLCGASEDGKWIAIDRSTGRARRALIVDLARDLPVATLSGQVSRIAFSSDGSWLAYETLAGDTAIVRRTAGGPAQTIHGRGAEFSMLALSPDGRLLATTGADFSIHIWDVASGKLAHATSGQYTPSVVAFTPDGRRVAVNGGGTDLGSALQIWEIARKEQLAAPKVKQRIVGASYSKDGVYLAVSAPSLEVFDTRTNASVGQFDCGSAPALSPVFSPNRKWVAANCGGVVTVWPMSGSVDAFHFGDAAEANNGPVLFSPDGRLLAAGSSTAIVLYDLAERRIVQRVKTKDPVAALAFSGDGEWLAVGGRQSLSMLNLRTQRHAWSADLGQPVGALRFTKDGHGLVVATDSLTLFDTGNGKVLRRLEAQVPNVSGAAISADGEWFGAGLNSSTQLWRLRVY
jgi:WD40 repeat protein